MDFITMTQHLEATIELYPSCPAVIEGDKSISFATLHEQATWVARALYETLNHKKNTIIAVYLPKSIHSVLADISILYSANAFMNLDIKNPAERIANILEQTNASLLITTADLAPSLTHLNKSIFLIDEILAQGKAKGWLSDSELQDTLNFKKTLIDSDPMCVINTSGSTGTPKSVILSHRGFLDITARAKELGLIQEKEIIGSLSPVFFDLHCFELCMLMSGGSAIVVLPETLAAFPIRILELLQQHKVTYLFWVPTIMVNIANMDLLSAILLPDLRMIWFAGEVFPTPKFNYWYNHLPHVTFANCYGPVEGTVVCTYYVINRILDDNEPIPIGFPFPNTDILVLDEEGNSVIEGNAGELCIRGASTTMGYYNDPVKTGSAFVQNPLNPYYPEIIYRTGDIVYKNALGELVYKGRKDSLIKHMGYRIELMEIEHIILNAHKAIKNCCAVYNKDTKQIILFFESKAFIEEVALRKQLASELPRYMLPALYIAMDQLPRNANGKIDRLKLGQRASTAQIQ